MPLTDSDAQAKQLRDTEFAAVADLAYLDHASDSPAPERTRRVIVERAELLANPLAQVRNREDYLADANRFLGELLNTTPDRFAYLTNAADATAAIANGIGWQPGDNVVLVQGEYPSFVLPWTRLARYGVDARFATPNGIETDLEAIDAVIDDQTRAVVISHVDFNSGYRNDLATIGLLAHAHGALFVVDASQSLGAIPVDVTAWGIDALVCVGYKWLMGPHGISVLYISESAQDQIVPTSPGRYSVRSGWPFPNYDLDWADSAIRYQGGALNWIGVCALAESIGLHAEVGSDVIARRVIELTDLLIDKLDTLPVEITSSRDLQHRSSYLTFTLGSIERDDTLVDAGKAANVLFGRRGGGVRVGTHFWNDETDLDRLTALVEQSAKA
ncbi:MAG TPA: aminotransferase class V-fold PLP-dependent enzyme [Thermomicrobiales bacterium]|nr:aminotransferase class V-fold PLP-dependent enzyme [Thermomicrobiales bacterium]